MGEGDGFRVGQTHQNKKKETGLIIISGGIPLYSQEAMPIGTYILISIYAARSLIAKKCECPQLKGTRNYPGTTHHYLQDHGVRIVKVSFEGRDKRTLFPLLLP
jgi:hypothetical protein